MAAPAKRCWIGGNFKSAATRATVEAQVAALNNGGAFPANAEVVIAPSAIHLGLVTATVRPEVAVAIQDIHTAKVRAHAPLSAWALRAQLRARCARPTRAAPSPRPPASAALSPPAQGLGAYTGSHTIDVVSDFGLRWVLTGHSERRTIFGETDAATATKTKLALDAGASAIVCIGESLPEREADATLAVCTRQLQAVVDVLAPEQWARVVVAYEPVWAIGTGKVATKEQAQAVHVALRAFLAEKVSPAVAAATRIVYGGSVSASNCASLIAEADIDGFLVGGASLKPEFLAIIASVATKA
jgi:triosephosphate isomerase